MENSVQLLLLAVVYLIYLTCIGRLLLVRVKHDELIQSWPFIAACMCEISAALTVDEIQVWKDVDVLSTAGPRLVPNVMPVSRTS
jgi:hypothetical protein